MEKIIAEIGQAHDGSLGTAHAYIDAIKNSKITALKFQTHIADAESSEFEEFRVPFSYEDNSRYDYWKRMEFSFEQWVGIKKHCDDVGLEFISSPFSIEAFEYLEKLNVDTYKVASGCVSNALLLDLIINTGKVVIISTGLYGRKHIDRIFEKHPKATESIALLHCITAYPAPIDKLNLQEIVTLKQTFPNNTIGYSDHSGEIWPSLVAAALGAKMIEFHITFDKRSFGPDSIASLNIDDAIYLADALSKIEVALYRDKLEKEPIEDLQKLFGYSLAARKDINLGDIVKLKYLETKKPCGYGIDPIRYKELVGKKTVRKIYKGEFINMVDLE